MEISGLATIFSEKVAVTVTTPEVMILSESLLERVNVACELHVPQRGLFSFDSGALRENSNGSELIEATHHPLMFLVKTGCMRTYY